MMLTLAVAMTMHGKAFLVAASWFSFSMMLFGLIFTPNSEKGATIAGYIIIVPTILFALFGAVTFILAS